MFVEDMSEGGVRRLRERKPWNVVLSAAMLFAVFGAMACGSGWLAWWLSGLDDGGAVMRGVIVFLPAFFLSIASCLFGLAAFGLAFGLLYAYAEAKAQEKDDEGKR